jgi:mannitol-specific phosphotransferase system IIBC component
MVAHPDSTTAFGTVTGTVLTVAATIDTQDYMKTVILAIVGASVSFIVSIILKWIWRK